MEPDATYKHILSFAFMVEELLRWLVADVHGMHELVDALDFSTLMRVQEQSVTAGDRVLHRHSNDMVWRVRLRESVEEDAGPDVGRTARSAVPADAEGAPGAESGRWLHLVVMLEFQAGVDYLMALRIRNYVDNFHMEQLRGKRFRSTDRLEPVLPIVLYNGASPWNAAARVIDLVTPGATQGVRGEVGSIWRADPLFAGDGYLLLDTHSLGPEDLRRDNAAALLAGLENPTLETVATQVASLHARLNTPELRQLKTVMLAWVSWVARRRLGLNLETRDMAEAERWQDADDIEAYYAAQVEAVKEGYRVEGREEGMATGRAEGQRALLHRHAELKFDAETAARLAVLLDGVTDPEVFDAVLAAIVERDTAADLLAHAAEVQRRATRCVLGR